MGTHLKDLIGSDLAGAMRTRDELKTATLRLLKSAITNKEIELKLPALDDAGVLAVIGMLVKQRRDAAEQYRAGSRTDLADRELAEIGVLQQYLPQQMSAEALAAEVGQIIAAVGAKGPRDMGAVMKAAGALKGRAEGKAISDEVRAQIARL